MSASNSNHVVQSSCLGIWKAKEREVGSAANQSLARLVACTIQGKSSHCLWRKRSRMRPRGTTGLLYVSTNTEQISKANRVGVGIPTKAHVSTCLFKASEWWLRGRLKVSLGPTYVHWDQRGAERMGLAQELPETPITQTSKQHFGHNHQEPH